MLMSLAHAAGSNGRRDGASYLVEPLDYAYGNLFTNSFESFNPAGTLAAEIRVASCRGVIFISSPRFALAAAILTSRIPPASISKSAIPRIRCLRLASITICRTRRDTRSIRIEKPLAVWFRPYLLWQPVFQYYWDAGGNSRIPNADILGFRVKVDF